MEKRLMTVVAGLALSTSMAFAQSQISGKPKIRNYHPIHD